MKLVKWALAICMLVPNYTLGSSRRTPIVQQYVIQQKIVKVGNPYAQTAYLIPSSQLGLNYYWTIVSDSEKQKQAELVADLVVQKLLNLGVAVETDDGTVQDTPQDKTSPEQHPETIDLKVEAIFRAKCASCHSEGTDNPLVLLSGDKLNQNLTLKQKFNIYDRTNGVGLNADMIMPKNQEPLPTEEINLILDWVRNSQ